MKKLLALVLAVATVLCMAPAFAISAAEPTAPKITLDGKLDDWAGLHTIKGTREKESYTFYGVMTAKGLYVAVDAYTVGFDAHADGDWWQSPNLEFFVGSYANDRNQRWVSLTDKDGGCRKEGNVTDAVASFETVEGDAPNHFIIEAFISSEQLDPIWINSDGSMKVGMACDTDNAAGGGYVRPDGTNERNNRAVVAPTGVYTHAEYAPANGVINATYYKAPNTVGYISDGRLVEDNRSARVGYENLKQFDGTIEKLLEGSLLTTTEKVTEVKPGNSDWYIYKWTGKMTAKEAGTYTLIARKIDNGFVMKVDGDKVFEYWGASHWFDGGNDRLVSDEGTFTLTAGQTVDVEIYFLELEGGDALEVFATTTPDDTNSGKNMNEAFTFDLTKEYYTTNRGAWGNELVGRGTGHNGSQCVEENFKFDESIDMLLKVMTKGESTKVLSFADAVINEDSYLVKYTGWLVPDESGAYTFGAYNMDNCFYLEIGGKTAYEFWSGFSWNDGAWGNDEEKQTYKHGNTYTESVTLEADKAYPFTAYFLETDGGQLLDLNCSINDGDKVAVDSAFTFYTQDPTPPATNDPSTPVKPAPTGDVLVLASSLAVLSLAAVVVSKKRRISK